MPAPAKRTKSKAGSSRGTAIAIDLDDSESEAPGSTAPSTGRSSRTKATSAKTAKSRSNARDRRYLESRTRQDLSSDSDDSSDAVVVATSRTIKGKQAATDRNSQVSLNRRKQMEDHSKPPHSASTSIQSISKPQSSSSIDRMPTPESLVTEESEAEPRRLLKADRTPVKQAATRQRLSQSHLSGGPSFLERLHSNATPQYSKSFKGKARSSASTSIPLNDERFASEESDEAYESEDKLSSRKSPSKNARKLKAASPDTSEAIDLEEITAKQKNSRHLHLQTVVDSSDEDLPSLPGRHDDVMPTAGPSQSKRFRNNLEELNQRRRLSDKKARSKEKHARRVVASPSPSPEPIVVVASRPTSSNQLTISPGSSRKKRINVRAIPSSGKPAKKVKPMFRAPSDESDADAADTMSEESDKIKNQYSSRSKKDLGKGKKRKVSSSSSSSSSSSASSAPPSEDELSEVEEDISLDFNPLVRDKLRPKDNSKAHRLDKLKQARAAKELRAKKRMKGIIDSDDEDAQPFKPQQGDSEDDEASTDEEEEEEDFIVEDNGDIDEEELARAERLMPTQFSKHGALTLEQHFYIFATSVVFRYFLPKSKHYRDSEEFKYSQSQMQNAIVGLINGSITSSIWKEDFRAALDARPQLEMYEIPYSPGCEGCNKFDRTASKRATLTGKPYDPDTFEDYSDEEEESLQEFDLGRFCAEKAFFHHSLRHFLKKASDTIRHECRIRSTLGGKLMGDKVERREQREREADRIVQMLSKGNVPLQRQLWIELDQLMERAKHKFLK